MSARIEHLVTSGTFSLDGQTFDVDNNVWLLGDDDEVLVIDAPHDADVIAQAGGDRTVVAIACSHAHDDHVRVAPDLGAVFTGDTLFSGGPGATGRSYSDYGTILDSIRTRLFTLPPETRVLTGHGDETTVGAEAPSYDEWVTRGS